MIDLDRQLKSILSSLRPAELRVLAKRSHEEPPEELVEAYAKALGLTLEEALVEIKM